MLNLFRLDRRRPHAFTLVELLVVIGIIAVLISVLLPTLNKARDRGKTISCQANLRQIHQAAMNYAAENRGRLPYGFIFNKQNGINPRSNNSGPTDANAASGFITYFSSVDKYMTRGATFPYTQLATAVYVGETTRKFSEVFRCPSASEFVQGVHYYENTVAMPHMRLEVKSTPLTGKNSALIAPARLTELFPDNALFWDTPVSYDSTPTLPLPFFTFSNEGGGTIPASQIDGGQLTDPAKPELRYRSKASNIFAGSPSSDGLAIEDSIFFPSDASLANNPDGQSFNTDMGGSGLLGGMIGSARFRHNGNKYCNVAFADGSVKSLLLNKNKTFAVGSYQSYDTEFRRFMLMIKWPQNKSPSGTLP